MITIVDVNLDHVAEVVYAKFVYYKDSPQPFYTMLCWKEVTMHKPYLRSRELCSTTLRVKYLHKLLIILLFIHSLIHLFNHLLASILDIGIIFISYFGLKIQCFFILLLIVFQLWLLGDLSVG